MKASFFGCCRWVLLISISILLVSCGDTERSENRTIKIGYLAIAATTPLFVAVEEGVFDEYGISVELIEFRTSNEIAVAAAAGHIDFIGIGATNAVIDVMNESNAIFELFLVNAYVKRPNNQSSDFLLASKDITSFEQLSGKTIAFMPGSIGRVFAAEIFPANGIELEDINYVEISPPQWLPAMMSGRVDAVTALEPFGTMIMSELDVNVLIDGYYAEVMPRVPVSGAWFIDGALSEEEEEKIINVYKDVLSIVEGDRSIAQAALTKNTSIPEQYIEDIRLNYWYIIEDEGDRKSAIDFAELFAKNGGINRVPDKEWLWSSR